MEAAKKKAELERRLQDVSGKLGGKTKQKGKSKHLRIVVCGCTSL